MAATLLQISDPHFGTEQPRVVEALLQLARAVDPDVVVLSGDITQRARNRQFRSARAFLDRMQPRALVAIPGNHDIPLFNIPARVLAPYANYSRAFGADLEPEFESADLMVIGVNTTRPRRHKDGELSPQQIERVASRSQRAPRTQVRIVVVHQPVLAIRDSDESNLLVGHREAIPRWAASGVDIVMGGHIHLPYVRSLRTTFPALPRDIWTVQAGTSVSSRIRDGVANSINVLHCDGASDRRRCAVERWDFDAARDRFERRDTSALTFDDA